MNDESPSLLALFPAHLLPGPLAEQNPCYLVIYPFREILYVLINMYVCEVFFFFLPAPFSTYQCVLKSFCISPDRAVLCFMTVAEFHKPFL